MNTIQNTDANTHKQECICIHMTILTHMHSHSNTYTDPNTQMYIHVNMYAPYIATVIETPNMQSER